MAAPDTSKVSRTSALAGWLVMLFYTAQSAIAVRMPRTEKTSLLREELRSWHYLIGLVLFALLLWRLWTWFGERRPGDSRLSPAARAWTRRLAFTSYLVLALMPALGVMQAFTEGLVVRLGPFATLPPLIAESRTGWMFSGYFHSALGFAVTLLTLASLVTGIYLLLRRGTGLLAAFPPGFGAQVWATFGITLYAFSTFRSPEPGVATVSIYLVLTAVLWAAGRWLAGRRETGIAQPYAGGTAGPVALTASTLGVLLLIAIGALGPYQMFRVTPWPMGEVVAGPEGATSHAAPVTTVDIAPETDFERQVRNDTYKWCRFCHTVEKGGKHLVGPNLYAIFGQRAGTAPNYYYSEAMAEAGRNGLVWDDEALDRFLAGPDEFLPGTSMIISSGPVKTPEERAAIINILKRETMPQ